MTCLKSFVFSTLSDLTLMILTLSTISNDLLEIDQTSLDIAESISNTIDFSRNIESAKLDVSNIIEEKRVRKSKKFANLAASLDIVSKEKELKNTSLINDEIKKVYSIFAVIIRSTRLHRVS